MERIFNKKKNFVLFLALGIFLSMCFSWSSLEANAETKVTVSNASQLGKAISGASGQTTIQLDGLIELTDTIRIPKDADISFVGGSASVNGIVPDSSMSAAKPLIAIAGGGGLTFGEKGAANAKLVIDGKSKTGVNLVDCSGRFTMNSGTIKDAAGTVKSYGGGVRVLDGGLFTMYNGEITGNKAYYVDYDEDDADSFGGGGVYVHKGGEFLMEGGVVNKNEGFTGAGIHVADEGKLSMVNGTITENACLSEESQGGGIYSNSDHVIIKAGTISKNRSNIGGGMYLHNNKKIALTNVLIAKNHAKDEGGGLWLCPLGKAELNVTEGAAIVPSVSDKTGDDLFSKTKDVSSGITAIELSSRILGGGPVTWYKDDTNVRFKDGARTAVPAGKMAVDSDFGLHAVASDADCKRAEGMAKVKFIDNYADWVGGGIATNGMTLFGEPDQDVSCKAIKKWNDDDDQAGVRPDSVQVQLYQNGKALGSPVTLTSDNGWQYEFKDLPAYVLTEKGKENCTYTVKEVALPGGYKASYDSEWDKDKKVLTLTITNKFSEDLEEEHTPGKDDPKTNSKDGKKPGTGVQTGDNSNMMIFIVLAVLAAAALGGLLWSKKKGIKS